MRYPDEVVRVDAVRRAAVPYKQCESRIGRTLDDLCVLGDTAADPDILLWGDSHMLAWAPGFDAALKEMGKSAYLAPNSACPPILGVDQSTDPLCRSQNAGLAAAITLHAEHGGKVKTIVLSGFWQKYFNDSNLVLSSDAYTGGNASVAEPKLVETLSRLSAGGFKVIVMGAVPAYPIDVPYAVSSGRQDRARLRYADMTAGNEHQMLRNRGGFVDVAEWFCADECVVQDEGGVLYRDSNHLAVHGAQRFSGHLAKMLVDRHTGGQP